MVMWIMRLEADNSQAVQMIMKHDKKENHTQYQSENTNLLIHRVEKRGLLHK